MSILTVSPGATVVFDPSDQRTIVFDFDTANLAAGVALASQAITITAIRQAGTALTVDNASLITNSRQVQARFLATTATDGDLYQVSVKGVTNETPAQTKDYSIFIAIGVR